MVFFGFDKVFEIFRVNFEFVFCLESDHHAAEVHADEIGEERRAIVARAFDVVFFEDAVGNLGAGFESKVFGEDESVVAVEEDVGDLEGQRKLDVMMQEKQREKNIPWA